MTTATAEAKSNIALIKYWGKRDTRLNLPSTGSLSMTLSSLGTRTTVTLDGALESDELVLNGTPATEDALSRMSRFLDRVRRVGGFRERVRVETDNNFPTRSGLASSASGFAALSLAVTHAAGMDDDPDRLAGLARLGSGSALRSLLGGLVELQPGVAPDGSDCLPRQLVAPGDWDVRLLVAMNTPDEKEVGSSDGMERTRRSSPLYEGWLRGNRVDLEVALKAVRDRDFHTLGRVTEASCFRMHAAAMGADPPIFYWNPVTLATVRLVRDLRESGVAGYVTIDAGPHVKVLCRPGDVRTLVEAIRGIKGIRQVIEERPGPGAELINASASGPASAG